MHTLTLLTLIGIGAGLVMALLLGLDLFMRRDRKLIIERGEPYTLDSAHIAKTIWGTHDS